MTMSFIQRLRCLGVVILTMFGTFGWAEGYRVGVNDQLVVQVLVWDQVGATVNELPGVSGIYPVGADGDISIALAGSVVAADRTTTQIAEALETAMVDYVGIGQSVKVGVSVEKYAPIYLAGHVKTPGVYDFFPGLTVHKALSLAGGAAGMTPVVGEERNYLSARGTINVLQEERMFLTARRDRLLAEIQGGVDLGASGADLDPTARAAEEAILQARNARYDYELTSLARARVALEEALVVLESKLATNRTQLEAGQAELQREEDLVERGLVAPIRVFERASYVNELESRLLDIERSILSARQEMQANERSEGQLLTARNEDNAITLQQVETNLAEVNAQLAGQYSLLSAAAGQQIGQLPAVDPLTADTSYTITRIRGGAATLSGDASTILMPGDVVEVVLEDPATATPSN